MTGRHRRRPVFAIFVPFAGSRKAQPEDKGMTDVRPDEDRSPEAAEQPITRTAEQARQGEIILTTRRRRIFFLSGLAGFVLLAVALAVLAR